MAYEEKKKSSKTTFTDQGHRRFAELLKRQMGAKTEREVEEEITLHYGKQMITHTTIYRQINCENYPTTPTIKVLAEYLGIPYGKAIAILEGKEATYADIMPVRTAEDAVTMLSKAGLSISELQRVAAAICTFTATKGAVPLINACV
jgi:hypothetical protein